MRLLSDSVPSYASKFAGVVMTAAMASGCTTATHPTDSPRGGHAAITHPDLRDQLNELFRRDQRARKAMLRAIRDSGPAPAGAAYAPAAMPAVREVIAIDAEAIVFLRAMLAEHGWPGFSMVGEDGAESAWLLAQHADADPELQAQVLDLMRPLVEAGQAKPSNAAYLEDRVRVARRQPQVYGTQFGLSDDGVQRPYPIDDPAQVDLRRALAGIEPVAAYARKLASATGSPAEARPMERFPPP